MKSTTLSPGCHKVIFTSPPALVDFLIELGLGNSRATGGQIEFSFALVLQGKNKHLLLFASRCIFLVYDFYVSEKNGCGFALHLSARSIEMHSRQQKLKRDP